MRSKFAISRISRGVIGPRGMTRAQITLSDDVLGKVVKTDAWQIDLAQSQIENIYRNSAETVKYLKAQYAEARGILTDLGLAKQDYRRQALRRSVLDYWAPSDHPVTLPVASRMATTVMFDVSPNVNCG